MIKFQPFILITLTLIEAEVHTSWCSLQAFEMFISAGEHLGSKSMRSD